METSRAAINAGKTNKSQKSRTARLQNATVNKTLNVQRNAAMLASHDNNKILSHA